MSNSAASVCGRPLGWAGVIRWGMSLCLLAWGWACTAPESVSTMVRPELPPPAQAEKVAVLGAFGGSLRYPLVGEPETFNLLAAQDARSRLIGGLLSGTLLEYDPVRQEVTGGLVRERRFNAAGTELSLTLREGVRFSDGRPLTAEDVVFTFGCIYDPRSNNVLKDTLLVDGQPLSIRQLSPTDLVITLPRPFAALEYLLTTVPVLPRHQLESHEGPIESAWTIETAPAEVVGLGPFVLAEHSPGRRTVLRFNPHYWRVDTAGRRLPYLDEVVFEYLADRNTQVLRLKSRELDLIDQLLRPEDLELFSGDEGFRSFDAGASSNLTFFWFNLNANVASAAPPSEAAARRQQWFRDRRFRQALSCAVSRETMVRNVYAGVASEATSFMPASNAVWHVADPQRFRYDPIRARRLLGEAGFRWKSVEGSETLFDPQGRPVEFELLTRADEVLGKIAAVIQQDLERIGIRVTVRQEEFRAVINRVMRSRDYDAALMNLDFPVEPADTANVLRSDGAMHVWNLEPGERLSEWEARIDSLMEELGRSLETRRRVELFAEVQRIIATEVPMIPLVNRNEIVVADRDLENLQIATVFPYALSKVWAVSWARH